MRSWPALAPAKSATGACSSSQSRSRSGSGRASAARRACVTRPPSAGGTEPGAWSWIKRVVTEQGELDPVPIELERSRDRRVGTYRTATPLLGGMASHQAAVRGAQAASVAVFVAFGGFVAT